MRPRQEQWEKERQKPSTRSRLQGEISGMARKADMMEQVCDGNQVLERGYKIAQDALKYQSNTAQDKLSRRTRTCSTWHTGGVPGAATSFADLGQVIAEQGSKTSIGLLGMTGMSAILDIMDGKDAAGPAPANDPGLTKQIQ
ncbi:MAG: hypothetical protein J3Q66DRAFT_438517 [Benniella sp.]|nr:MAG: hypothetical protein J3Q66DRAFT_438517 [Benniella sp.]